MFQKVLVPLDGTELAEGILPYVSFLARGLNIPLVLVSVVDLDAMGVPRTAYDVSRKVQAGLLKRLKDLAGRLAQEGVKADTMATSGHAAEEIVRAAHDTGCDLIAMSTHGRSTLGRGILGSVADKVVHSADVPVLVMTPQKAREYWQRGVSISRILAPLDGSTLAESALPYIAHLAEKLKLEVILIRVVEPSSLYEAYYRESYPTVDLLEEMEKEATSYLNAVADTLKSSGARVQQRVLRGPAARRIIEIAAETPEDIVVLATHGRSGLTRFVLGSVAEALVRGSGDPVLIIPAKVARTP